MKKTVRIEQLSGVKRVREKRGWDDLVLPQADVARLKELVSLIQSPQMSEKNISKGSLALFSGLSGTGKTFTGEVANALGWPLFRVDLGMLVSKYIGETEKNLNALFDAAAGQKMVLLFDEADSLFGKRGEVKEARDRYANMGVSHLLSRIERFNGLALIACLKHRKYWQYYLSKQFSLIDHRSCLLHPEASETGEVLYLDVWERTVTFLDDTGLRDPALAGSDTSTRTHIKIKRPGKLKL